MDSPFDTVHEQINKDLSEREASPESSQQHSSETDQARGDKPTAETAAQAIADLGKFQKIKFEGQEWTLDDLKKAILRQKDYTQKTQSLAEERKVLEAERSERKFYENLHFDLAKVRDNPGLAQEFIRTYPEKFHSYLKDILGNNQAPQSQANSQSTTPQIPIELMSQVQRLQSFVESQEVAKAETEIESNLSKALTTHKYANRKEVLADAYELHNRGQKLTSDLWDKLAKESHDARKAFGDTYYKDLVSQQSKANRKGQDVGAGGGTPGQAPKKFDPKQGLKGIHKDVLAAFGSKQ